MSISEGEVAVPCGWEGNRRSGVARVMHRRFGGISTYGLNALRKGDEHPACTPLRRMAPFNDNNNDLEAKDVLPK